MSESLRNSASQRFSGSSSASDSVIINWAVVLPSFALAVSYYAALLSLGSPRFLTPAPGGLTFNSMLLHMLNGSFDVDPETIGIDGVVRNGLTYTYFGIVPALLRLPLLPISRARISPASAAPSRSASWRVSSSPRC